MNTIQYPHLVETLFARAEEDYVLVNLGWTVLIPRAQAVEYVKRYNTKPNFGFYEHEDKINLQHGDGKVAFTQQEGTALVELIKAAYPEA